MSDEEEIYDYSKFGLRKLKGSRLERAVSSLNRDVIATRALSEPMGRAYFLDGEFPQYGVRYNNSEVLSITLIDKDSKDASVTIVKEMDGALLTYPSLYFQGGRLIHEGDNKEDILVNLARRIKDNRDNFSELDEIMRDYLKEAYELSYNI